MICHRISRSARQRPDLAHPSTEELAEATCLLNKRGRPDEARPNGRAEAFAEAQRYAVERRTELREWRAGLCDDVPQPRTVEVHGDPLRAREFGDGDDFGLGDYSAV